MCVCVCVQLSDNLEFKRQREYAPNTKHSVKIVF